MAKQSKLVQNHLNNHNKVDIFHLQLVAKVQDLIIKVNKKLLRPDTRVFRWKNKTIDKATLCCHSYVFQTIR